jgi:hypothetical protein
MSSLDGFPILAIYQTLSIEKGFMNPPKTKIRPKNFRRILHQPVYSATRKPQPENQTI